MASEVVGRDDSVVVDLKEILFPSDTDVLVNGSQEKFGYKAIEGKVVGLVLGPHWLPSPLYQAISVVIGPYEEVRKKGAGEPLVMVYVSLDRDEQLIKSLQDYGQGSQVDESGDEESFSSFLTKMPQGWLAVPFTSSAIRNKLLSLFRSGIFSLAFVGAEGEIASKSAWDVLEKWGADAFPFTRQRIQELEAGLEALKANQSLKSLLTTEERQDLVSSDGSKVKVADLEGKPVALYFSAHWCPPCRYFTPTLAQVYKQLKAEGKEVEVVFVSADEDEEAFEDYLQSMPWLAIPFTDVQARKRLNNVFEVEGIPTLIFLDGAGKTLQCEEAVALIRKYGAAAYPFTPERVEELEEKEKAERDNATVESILSSADRDYVVKQDGEEVKISSLHETTVGIYFSAHWCPPCRAFTPKLVEVYKELNKEEGKQFEIVFVSSDKEEESFKSYYAEMPWLALPFEDRKKKAELSTFFSVEGIPTLVILSPGGKTLTLEGRTLVDSYGAKAFPFTSQRLEELKAEADAEIQALPEEAHFEDHPHPLLIMRSPYPDETFVCDVCGDAGERWAYRCDECGFDVHPHCVANATTETQGEKEEAVEEEDHLNANAGFVCEGDVCRRV